MFDKPQATHVLGLEIDANILKGVALTSQRGKPKIESSFSFPVEFTPSEAGNVKPLYNPQQKQQLEALAQKCLIATSISTPNILVRPLDLKIKKTRDIDAVLSFQAEPILPYPVENAVLDRIFLSQDKEGSHLVLTAARKDHLTQHLALWNGIEIDPEVVSAAPFALSLFAKHFTPAEEIYYVLYLGISQIFCILVDKGKLIAAQSIQGDLLKLLESLAQAKGIDLAAVRAQLDNQTLQMPALNEHESVKSAVEDLRLSVTRTTFALAKQIKGREVNAMLVTGPGANIEGLPSELVLPLNKSMVSLQTDESIGMTVPELHSFALPIGAALSALPLSDEQINFRQNEFAYPAPWKRLKGVMATYLLLCLGLAIALVIYGKSYNSYREGEIKRHYLELLNVMNKPYAEFEKEYSSKVPSSRELSGEVPNVSSLTSDEIKGRLNYLEKEIQATPQTYPLLPNVPLVSDVLAWISTHPSFVGTTIAESQSPPSLQIESFNYTLVKRPEPTKKQEKYQVKIELEFSSPTPKMAREFHDALIAPNEFVDPKGEIKWNSNRDKYRTSFYLKDKTVYPSL